MACRQLGYNNVIDYGPSCHLKYVYCLESHGYCTLYRYPCNQYPLFHLDQVDCSQYSFGAHLLGCSFTMATHDCSGFEAVGIICSKGGREGEMSIPYSML